VAFHCLHLGLMVGFTIVAPIITNSSNLYNTRLPEEYSHIFILPAAKV
jgi:hypothetical protein